MSADHPSPKSNGAGTRFQRGNCCNPWGRKGKPKEAPSFEREEIERRFLAEPITMSLNGKPLSVSTYEGALIVLRGKAMRGETQALRLLLTLAASKSELARAAGSIAASTIEESDEALITAYVARAAGSAAGEGGDDE